MKPMMNLMRTLAAGAIVAVGLAGAAVAQDLKFFTIGTGGTGYTYYPVGGLIANASSKPPARAPVTKAEAVAPSPSRLSAG